MLHMKRLWHISHVFCDTDSSSVLQGVKYALSLLNPVFGLPKIAI